MDSNGSSLPEPIPGEDDGAPDEARIEAVLKSTMFSGPLPHPEIFQAYEDVSPGSAERILAMTEREQGHRMALEREALGAKIACNARGQWFGFSLSCFGILGALVLLQNGMVWPGGIFGLFGVSGVLVKLAQNLRKAPQGDLNLK